MIQEAINQILGSVGAGAGIAKGVKALEANKQQEKADAKEYEAAKGQFKADVSTFNSKYSNSYEHLASLVDSNSLNLDEQSAVVKTLKARNDAVKALMAREVSLTSKERFLEQRKMLKEKATQNELRGGK